MAKNSKKPKKGGIALVISIGGKPKGDEPKMKPGFPIDKAQLALLKALTTEELREASRTGGIRRLPGTQGGLSPPMYGGTKTGDARLTGTGANRVVAAQRAGGAEYGGDTHQYPQLDMGGRMPKSSVMGEGTDFISGTNSILQPHEEEMMTELHPDLREAALADFHSSHGARIQDETNPVDAGNKPKSLNAERDAALKPPSVDAALRDTYGDDRADRVAVQDTVRDLSDTAGLQGMKRGLQDEIAHNERMMDTKERRAAAAKAKADARLQQSLSGERAPPVAGSAEARRFSAARSAQPPSNPRRGRRRRFMTNAQKRNRQMRRKSEPMDLAFRLLKGWADSVEPSSEDDPEGRRMRENDQFEEFMRNLDDPEFAAGVERDPEPLGESEGPPTADSAVVRRLIQLLGENKVPSMRR